MSGAERNERKQAYFGKLIRLFESHTRVCLVSADNVASSHMQKIRMQLRGKGTLLMGKNTMIRKAVRGQCENNPALEALVPYIKGNIGFIFSDSLEPSEIAEVLVDFRVAAPAKAGTVAPVEVSIPAGPTGLDPGQTGFLQALNIASKIVKGQIEIVNPVTLFKVGDRVGQSESALLQKLNIKPFTYGMEIATVYDNGSVYDASLLGMGEAEVVKAFQSGVARVAAVSLATGLPTIASLPHSVLRGYKKVLAVSLATDYTFEQARELKELLANPEAMAAAAAAAASSSSAGGASGSAAPAAAEAEPEPEEESDEDMGFGLFD
jgi:large subunit ribosomal protein LP0